MKKGAKIAKKLATRRAGAKEASGRKVPGSQNLKKQR
jgi:hypothetical protein